MVAVAEAGVVEEYRVLWWNENCELWYYPPLFETGLSGEQLKPILEKYR